MFELDYLAHVEQQYREDAQYPTLAQHARHLRDLELARAADARLQRGLKPAQRRGWGVLATLRARLSARPSGVTSASRS